MRARTSVITILVAAAVVTAADLAHAQSSAAGKYIYELASSGQCTDPDAWWWVTCNSVVDCVYDCNGSCNPLGC